MTKNEKRITKDNKESIKKMITKLVTFLVNQKLNVQFKGLESIKEQIKSLEFISSFRYTLRYYKKGIFVENRIIDIH